METVQFKTKIKDDSIQITAKYRGKFKDSVRVILMADDTDLSQRRLESLFATKVRETDGPAVGPCFGFAGGLTFYQWINLYRCCSPVLPNDEWRPGQ